MTVNKKSILLVAPIGTSSGYGARSRDIAKALLSNPNYDVAIINTRWGSTPQNFLNASNPEHELLLSKMVFNTQNLPQPDISIQITVPNEFKKLGKYSIGMTAGIETTIAPPEFLQGCNGIDEVIFSSEFSRNVHVNSSFNVHDQESQKIVDTLQLKAKSSVLFEGIDDTVYFKAPEFKSGMLSNMIKSIPEQFCFLTVGHWLGGEFNEDRKNISGTIWAFMHAFKNKKNAPALILKSSCGTYSKMDEEEILNRIDRIRTALLSDKSIYSVPNVYLLHGDLSDSEMNELYNNPKVKAMLLLTKGEGFGRPLAEFAISGKPIIVPNYSGYLDFLPAEMTVYVPGKLTQVHPTAADGKMILNDASWYSVDLLVASNIIKNVFNDYSSYQERSRKYTKYLKDNFSYEKMKEKLYAVIDAVSVAEVKQFKLPTLKKITPNETT